MRHLLLMNAAVIAIIVLPLVAVQVTASSVRWLRPHKDVLSAVVWFAVILWVYGWLLPRWGLAPNRHFFTEIG